MRLIIENDGREIHIHREAETEHQRMQKIRRKAGLMPVTFDEVEQNGGLPPERTWACCKMATGR